MVTSESKTRMVFGLEITRSYDGSVKVLIQRPDGASRAYNFPEKKVQLYKAIDGPVKDAVEFLLGEA
jgi:hypothetical protein